MATKRNKDMKDATVEFLVDSMMKEASSLATERETFETEELARTNKALYAILAKVYALYKTAFKEECVKEVAKAMTQRLKERGVKVQSNTPIITVFVRFVFNSDRKRAYNYANTLLAAIQANVAPDNLADFIEGKNGVEECKKEYKMKEETRGKIAKLKTATVDAVTVLETMRCQQRVTLGNASVEFCDGTQFAFIAARSLGNGEFELLNVVPTTSKALETAALNEFAKQYVKIGASAAACVKETQQEQAMDRVIKSATAKDVATMTMAQLDELEAA